MPALLIIAGKWVGLLGMVLAASLRSWPGLSSTPQTHYLWGMTATFLVALAQTMTIYYFGGMKRALLEATRKHDLDPVLGEESVAMKKTVSKPGYLVALTATASLICAGGALARQLPIWIHVVLGAITIVGGVYTGLREFACFRRNAALFDRAATAVQRSTTSVAPQGALDESRITK